MHGFFDVVWGLLLGLVIAVVQCLYGEDFDNWIYSGPFLNVVIVTLVVLVLVRMHPEPADDCPCFDDSVSFSAVFIGIQLGAWHFVRSGYSWDQPVPSTTPFDLEALGWAKNLARIMLGIFIVFTWRGITKPILLRILPPIFRVIEHLGLSLPRKFFLPATEYKRVPPLRKDDNVIPPVSEIPRMITSLRHPRKRAISIGPQSEADAYEALAFRDSRRRQSLSSPSPPSGRSPLPSPTKSPTEVCTSPIDKGVASSDSTGPGVGVTVNATVEKAIEAADADSSDAKDDHEMFLRLLKPRVRYDVEVVTKLIVYTGIAWLSVAGNAIIFELCGLGMGKRP
ncbi:MAG: hypothetical protein M1831_002759 [Alyxoria varia]|nr:MAG: hypothetical protein M1831_002759 [Alyxoria varia]